MQITEHDTFKKSSSEYALDRGAPSFDIIDVKSKKDQEYNLAIQQAQKEFENLKQIADVINQQAMAIKERLELTKLIYTAEYNFKPVAGNTYWLINDISKNITIISVLGPNDWSAGSPENYKYIGNVRFLANGLWEKVKNG